MKDKISTHEGVLHLRTTGDLEISCASPSDLSPNPDTIRRSNSSPVQSDLPSLFNNLRANEVNPESTGRSLVKRFLSIGKADEKVEEVAKNGTDHPLSNKLTNEHKLAKHKRNSDSDGRVTIPPVFLKDGMPLLKVSHKSKKRIVFNIDPDNFILSWNVAPTATKVSPSASTQLYKLLTPTSKKESPKGTGTKYHREISIDDIKNVLFQEDASNYREELHISKEYENTWLTLFYYNEKKKKLKTLHVIADSEHDFRRLISVLLDLKKLRDDLARNFLIDLDGLDEVRRSMILEGGKQIKEFLSFHDILKYSKRLNISVSSSYLRKVFDQVSPDDLSVDFEQFKMFVSILKHREDILEIFKNLNSQDPDQTKMTYSVFRRFIKTVQYESYHDDQIMRLFNTFSGKEGYISSENFNNYLSSKYNNPINFTGEHASKNNERNDLYFDKPLNEYFICSSHNTYLLGRQIAGDSSIEGYIRALQRGCRCVEIDVWDGDSQDELEAMGDGIKLENDDNSNVGGESEPVVSHGRTFTTSISLLNVIKTIKKYAFMTSPYPVILSLEVHCNKANQLKMITILKEILGDMLVQVPIANWFGLPSPKDLKHKILIKVKRTSDSSRLSVSESGKYYSSTTSTTTSFSEDNSKDSLPARKRSGSFSLRRSKSKAKNKICEELSDLGVYIQGRKFINFSLPESKTFNHCFSISEKVLNSMLKDDVRRVQVDKHNRRYLMRTYPSKIRLTSTNFSPIPYWSHGVQMVATNWQTYDLGQQLNEALFEGVNKSGYVIKPIELRKPLLKSMREIASSDRKILFCIEVVSAHQLPKPRDTVMNPFITFEIIGATDITWSSPQIVGTIGRTTTLPENGFNPTWNQKFSGIINASNDFVFIRFLINSETENDINSIGIVVMKLSDLKRGYRYLAINDVSGEELIYSQLFVRIDYQEIT